MSRNNHVDEQHGSVDGADIAEVTQLCHEYTSEREDFHKLGFQCLLKKLKEIEKIILTISKMSGNEALQYHKNTINAFKDDLVEAANTFHQRAAPEDIQLPDDLTSHSKQVLHEIFQQLEANIHNVIGRLKIKLLETLNEAYCVMESTANAYREAQKSGAKSFIEGLLNSDTQCSDPNQPQVPRNATKALPATNEPGLRLPEDLSPFTKSVLNEIFANYEIRITNLAESIKKQVHELLLGAFGQFESSVDSMTESQSAELKREMESIFGDPNGGRAPRASKVKLSKSECGFDAKLARHFHELSRVVQVILDKKDSTAAATDDNRAVIDENRAVVDENRAADEGTDCLIDGPDQVEAPVAGADNADEDDLNETNFMGVPDLQMGKKRLARMI